MRTWNEPLADLFPRLTEDEQGVIRYMAAMLSEGRCPAKGKDTSGVDHGSDPCGRELVPVDREVGDRARGRCYCCGVIWYLRDDPDGFDMIGWDLIGWSAASLSSAPSTAERGSE